MVKTLLLSAAFLLSAVWLQGQDQSSSSSGQTGSSASSSSQTGSSQSGNSTAAGQTSSSTAAGQTSSSPAGAAANAATVQGCLHNSGGNYILVSDTGSTYQLQGDTSKLAEHVEHEVAISGSASANPAGKDTGSGAGSSSGAASSAGAAAGAEGSPQGTINVTGVEHVSKTCTGAVPAPNAPTK